MPDPARPPRHRLRRLTALAAVVASAGALSSCGGDGSSAAADATVLEVELGRYTIVPNTLTAPAGVLELRVTNVDTMVHNLVVAGKGTRQLAPGESQDLPIGEIGVGEYRMWCDVQGHAQMGQSGMLVIEPPAAPAASAPGT